jgi:hypothetical protein
MVRKVYGIIYVISFALFPWLVLSPAINLLANIPLRLGIFCLLSLGGAFLFRQTWPRQGWSAALLLTTLGYGYQSKFTIFQCHLPSFTQAATCSSHFHFYSPIHLYGLVDSGRLFCGLPLPP